MEGLRGFFRGSQLSVVKTTISFGIFFTNIENISNLTSSYEFIQRNLFLQNFVNFTNGAISKSLSSFAVSPVVVLKTRFEVVGTNEFKSIYQAGKSIIKNEGFSGFYKGMLATLLRDVPFSGIQFAQYQFCLDIYKFFRNKDPQNNNGFIIFAGGFSSAAAIMITYPFDNIRIRYQFNKGKSAKLIDFCKEIYQNEGVWGFYKGYMPRLIKKIFTGAIIWSVYEKIKATDNKNSQ